MRVVNVVHVEVRLQAMLHNSRPFSVWHTFGVDSLDEITMHVMEMYPHMNVVYTSINDDLPISGIDWSVEE